MRGSLGLALVVVSACTIELAPRPRPPTAPPRSTSLGLSISTATLASGLRVVMVRDPRATEVQVTMRYQVGASADESRPGVAHLVEHLMFQQQLDGQPLFTHLEDTATYFNAATTFDTTTYVSRGPAGALDKLLAIEAIRLEERCKTVSDAAFERERQVVVNELEQRDQATELYKAIHIALYPEGHPYRQSIGGSVASVSSITREQACQFADSHYAPGNAVLVVSGRLAQSEVDSALAMLRTRIAKRAGAAPHPLQPAMPRPQHVEVPAPIDQDVLVLAWPLPLDPELQANVRAIGAALPRLVDAEIKGSVVAIELGDSNAPMLGLAVLPGADETFKQAVDGTRRGVEGLPKVFRESQPDNVDEIVFDRIKQGALYNLYSELEDGSGRDGRLASAVLAGRSPSDAVADELRTLRELSREKAADLAAKYLAVNTPTVVTLKASAGKKRGDKITLRAPIHDFGQRRTPVDPALANRPAEHDPYELVGARTRVLPNGLKVVLLPMTTVPTFDARLIFSSGTGDEPEAQQGVALLAAHTLTWDLHHIKDVFPFVRAGGMRNTDVASDGTSFSVQGLDMNLDVVLAGLRRWVCDGVYDDSAANFVNAMRRAAKRGDDQGVLTDTWRASLFGANHPYVKAGIVRHANNALTLDDARRFRAAHYTPDNATLVIAGRFDRALADRWVDFLFSDWGGRAEPRQAVQPRSQPASIASLDDTTLVQLRFAIPAEAAGRAQRLVAAAMLSDVARDVRYRLGASYTFDAQLAETRLATFFVIGGWVDAARAVAAVELINDRVRELRRDETAASRAFVIARSHVLTQLHSRVGSAGALADRVERDVELAREPLSDLQTATAVEALTIADMSATLADLDLSRATVLMDGPATDVDSAFNVLGRKPSYLQQPPPSASSAPGATPPAFKGEEQLVLRSELIPSLTEQPLPRRMLTLSAGTGLAGTGDTQSRFSGYSFTTAVGYRYGWTNAVGVHLGAGRFASDTTDSSGLPRRLGLIPINLLAMWHLGGTKGSWGDILFGLHVGRLTDTTTRWRTSALYGLQGGLDIVRGIGVALRWESTTRSAAEYYSLSIGLVYRR